MNLLDYAAILLTFLLYDITQRTILCYAGSLSVLHHDRDLTEGTLNEFLLHLDRRFGSRWLPPLYLTTLSFVAWPFIHWGALDPTHILQPFYSFLGGIIAWRACSLGKNWYRNSYEGFAKCILVASCILFYFYPGFVLPLLFVNIHFLHGWTPVQGMVNRILQLFATFLVATVVIRSTLYFTPWGSMKIASMTSLFLSILVISSHYVVLGWSKMRLGKQWYSWITNNRSDYQAVSASMWGWVGGKWASKWRSYNVGLQTGMVLIECGWLFVFFNDVWALILCSATLLYHLYSFLKSGILYWPSMLVNVALYVVISKILPAENAALFNVWNGLLGIILLVGFPLQGMLWSPPSYALWDTPFIGRIDWKVVGLSGKIYSLYNFFMGPYARFFGSAQADFLIPRKIFHKHLGQVATLELRNAVVNTKGEREKIEALQEKYGVHHADDHWKEIHDTFLKRYFIHYNKGRRRSRMPWWFLKAPETYWFDWGADIAETPFVGQERVTKVLVSYREEFFDGEKNVIIRQEPIEEIVIPVKPFKI